MKMFSVSHCKSLSFKEQIEYIEEFFIPLSDGNHAVKENDKYVIITDDILKRVYFGRLSSLLNQYYFNEYDKILTPIYDETKPQFYDSYINLSYNEKILPPHIQFLVDEFINKNQGLNHKPKDLYDLYVRYVKDEPLNKNSFMNELSNLKINTIKSGTNIYKLSYEDLFNIGLNNKWYFKDTKDVEIDNLKKEVERLNSITEKLQNHINNLEEENKKRELNKKEDEDEEEDDDEDEDDEDEEEDDEEDEEEDVDDKFADAEDEEDNNFHHIGEDLIESL